MNRLFVLFFASLSLFIVTTLCPAQDAPAPQSDEGAEQLNTRRAKLTEEAAIIQRVREELQALGADTKRLLQDLQAGQLNEDMVKQGQVELDAARLRKTDLETEIANTERRIAELEQAIRQLESKVQLLKNPAKDPTEGVGRAEQLELTERALAQQREELELERPHLQNLRTRVELANQRLALLEPRQVRFDELFRQQQEQSRRTAQQDLTQRLQREQQDFQNKAALLSQRLQNERALLSESQRILLESQILNAEERARLIQIDIRLGAIGNELAKFEGLLEKPGVRPEELAEGLPALSAMETELADTATLLQQKIDLYQHQKQVIEKREGLVWPDIRNQQEELQIVTALIEDLQKRLVEVKQLLTRTQATHLRLDARHKELFSQRLFDRMLLPVTLEDWGNLIKELARTPEVLLYQIRLSVESTVNVTLAAKIWQWMAAALIEGLLLWLLVTAWRSLERAINHTKQMLTEDNTFVGNAVLIFLLLFRKNLGGVYFSLALLSLIFIVQVPQPGLSIIVTLVLLWLAIKLPINLVWLLLASPHLPSVYRRLPLYRQLLVMLFSGGLLAAVIILARLTSMSDTVVQTFDRVFMLYLLFAFLPVLRLRGYIIWLLEERYAERVWFIALRLVILLLSLSLLVAAAVGLAGYLNLAWAIAWHLVVFILVLAGWLVVRGLFNDLTVYIKNFAVMHSSYGLLWTQDVINPVHRIVHAGLFVAAWIVLFQIYGWDNESTVTAAMWDFLDEPLFSMGGAAITPWIIVVTVLTVYVVIWFGQWARAVTYRWIFSRIIDLGVRHSLSVFIQYAIVLTGVLICLRILGLDMTTLAVFAGAVGVGIGFGMQTIANNFISGLLLLIERPLRSGDTVQIGTNTGEITRIGIRSLTLKTWDNTDVIIPNSDVITSAFTNWTHSDNVIRTVLMISVNCDADPHQAYAIIEQVIREHAEILENPEYVVSLWEFANSAIIIRVHYFTDFFKSHILKVRSQVMFTIYDRFKEIGIEVYFPHQGIRLKEWPEGVGAPAALPLPKLQKQS